MANAKRSVKILLAVMLSVMIMLAFLPAPADAAAKPGKVSIKTVKCVTKNQVQVTWKKLAKNVKKYQIFKKAGNAKWKAAKTVSKSKSSYNTTVNYGTKTQFKVRAVSGSKKGKFSKVKTITIKRIKMSAGTVSVEAGSTKALSLKNAVGKVSWSAGNTKIAKVSGGKLQGVSPGETTITAKNRGQVASCGVYVNGYLNVDEAYKLLNDFRTSTDVWQWNEDNKTKTYFNKAGATTLDPLVVNKELEKTAKVRAKEISKLFDHTRPNGEPCYTAFPDNCWARGENIAGGQTSAKSVTEVWKETNEKYDGQ